MAQGKLLDTAIREFGAKGLDGASTRGIAAEAGTAMSAITYHFGGKDGLYLAAAAHIEQKMKDGMAAVLDARTALAADDPAAARAALHKLVADMAERMAGEASADWTLFIIREQLAPGEAFERLYAGAMGELLRTMGELVCAATGLRDQTVSRIAAMTIFGEVRGLRASRAMWLRLLDRSAFGADDLVAIQSRLAANTDAILDRLIAEQQIAEQ